MTDLAGISFDHALDLVSRATEPGPLFGSDEEEARKNYRLLARVLHPDVAPDGQTERATVAAALLNALWDRYKSGASGTFEITTKKRTYTVESALARDGISQLYPCSWMDGDEHYGMLRLPRSPKFNEMMAAEARALQKLDQEGDPKFRNYAPVMVESFRFRDRATRVDRRANVTERQDSMLNLAEVHEAFPSGMDGRDVAWIWRRMLAGIGWAHRAGVINGAIVPEHVLIHPVKHGVVFANWCYSVVDGGRITHAVSAYKSWYPQSVLDKQPARTEDDIHMIAKCMEYLLGEHNITQFRAFIRGCTLSFGALPDAWEVQREFDELIERLYGPRKYRPLIMPSS